MAATYTVTDLAPGRPFQLGKQARYPMVPTSTGSYPVSETATSSKMWCKLYRFTATGAHTSGGDVAALVTALNGIGAIGGIFSPCTKTDNTDAYTVQPTFAAGGLAVALGQNPNLANTAFVTTHTDTITDYYFDALIYGYGAYDR